MWRVDAETQDIVMTRGDTPSFEIQCNTLDGEGNPVPYVPEEEDVFIFACKESKGSEPAFIVEIPKDTMTVSFKEEYTKNLKGTKFIWEVSLNNASTGYHCTFICEKNLILRPEVY